MTKTVCLLSKNFQSSRKDEWSWHPVARFCRDSWSGRFQRRAVRPVWKERCQEAFRGPSSGEAEDKQADQREKEWGR